MPAETDPDYVVEQIGDAEVVALRRPPIEIPPPEPPPSGG